MMSLIKVVVLHIESNLKKFLRTHQFENGCRKQKFGCIVAVSINEYDPAGPAPRWGVGGATPPLSLFQSANWQLQSVKWGSEPKVCFVDPKCFALHV